jgi:hypothetical protein
LKKEKRKRVSIELSEDVYLTVSAIKKKTGLSYSAITDKVLQDATISKSINSISIKLFPDHIK